MYHIKWLRESWEELKNIVQVEELLPVTVQRQTTEE